MPDNDLINKYLVIILEIQNFKNSSLISVISKNLFWKILQLLNLNISEKATFLTTEQ